MQSDGTYARAVAKNGRRVSAQDLASGSPARPFTRLVLNEINNIRKFAISGVIKRN